MDYLNQLGNASIKTIAIIFEDTAFGQSAAVAAAQAATDKGIHIVAYEIYKRGTSDQTELLQRVKNEDPDAIYMAAYLDDAKRLMQQSRIIDLNPQLFIGNAGGFVTPEFLSIGADAEYVIVTTQWGRDVAWAGASRSTEKFNLEYNMLPPMRSAATYTAVFVAKDAIERAYQAQSTLNQPLRLKTVDELQEWRKAIRVALENTDMKHTIFGPIHFDENGQNSHATMLAQILDGEYITIYPEEHRARPYVVPVPSWDTR
jgi:branched-chain amino acid transport system substrate-binding protein